MLPDQWELVVLGPVVVVAVQVYFDQHEHCCLQDFKSEVELQDLELGFELQVLELDFDLPDLELDLQDLAPHPQIDLEDWD